MEEEENNKPQLPLVPANLAPNTIKLSDLIDFAVQQVFHEITVLSELLPKKMDGDRKVSLVQFAHNTRMLFVKLLALVKWVKSSKKFEQCTAISYFLEQQGQLLLDSADRLFHIREEMTYARLPPFQLSEAVDTLTLGNYARVPTCIKEAFVKKTKLTAGEQGKVLGRLNQIIHTRLSRESMKMSPRIKDIRIRNGHVTLVVPGEFEVQLTVLGDKIGMPWTLLNIKMLVEDYEIGYGSQLVHPLQLNRIHLELQKRLEEWQEQKQDPLANLYKFLHRFAQSLQLDVLWCQATQIGGHDGQYAERIMIEKYDSKERVLTIGYWLKRIYLRPGSSQFRVTSEYRISIMGTDDDGPLKVVHSPAYPGLGTLDDRSGRLSVDRLLADTLVVRARERLLRIRKRIEAAEPKMPIAFLGQAVPYLRMPLLKDSMTNPHECLSVSISLYSGKVLCDLIALNQKERAELQALEKMLYDCPPVDTLRKQFSKFKVKVMIERIKKAITTLQVKLVSESQMSPFLQNLISLPAERVFLQFAREEYYYVIVTFDPREDLTLKLGFHLLSLVEDKAQLLDLTELPQVFASLKKVIHLEALEYQEGDVYEKLLHERRRLTSQEKQLICGIAAVDDRLGILRIKQELEKRGIQNIAVDEEKEIGGMVVNIANLANIPEVKSQDFANHVHRCSIRLDSRGRGAWLLELTMGPPPLYRNKREGAQRPVRSTFITDMKGSVADNGGIAPVIIDRLVTYSNIFDIVKKFARVYERFYKDKCTILAFTYHKLVLSYGTERDMLLTVTFQSKSPQQQQSDIAQPFKLAFGCVKKGFAETDRANPHTLMAAELTRRFNKTHDLLELINHLVLTLEPMVLIHNYHRTRLISVRPYCYAMNLSDVTFPMIMKGGITVINRYTVRLTYGDIHLEIAMLMDNRIAIRDSSRGTPKAAGLVDRVIFAEEEKGQTYIVPDPTEYESAIVNNMIGCNVPIPTHTLAVATPKTEGNSPREQRSPAAQNLNHLVGSRNVFTTSLSTFKKVMKWEPVEGKTRQLHCVLDDHLNYLCFIQRVANLMEQFKNGQGHQSICNGLQIKDVYRDVDHVKVVFPSVGSSSSMVSFHLFLDKCTWCLRVKINYTESEPSEENLSTLEEYAQRKVVETWNEMAVCSFLMLLRLTPYQGVDAIASFLKTPNIIFPMACKVNLSNEKPSWKYGTGFLVQDINIQFLVCFVQSPPPQDAYFTSPNPPVPQKKVFCVSYNWETNLLKLTTQNQSAAPNPEDAVFEQINKDAVAKNISAVFTFLNFYNGKFCGNAPQQLPPMPNYSTASVISLDSSTMNPGSNLLY